MEKKKFGDESERKNKRLSTKIREKEKEHCLKGIDGARKRR